MRQRYGFRDRLAEPNQSIPLDGSFGFDDNDDGGQVDDPEESIELPLELGWASLRWEKLHEIRDFRIDMLVPTSLAMFGGGKQRWELSEPQAVAIPASEFKSYLMVQGYEGEYLSIMIDDCMMFETIYLRLHRLRARENVKRMNS